MIRVGPAGWSYQDWEGIVYPAKPPMKQLEQQSVQLGKTSRLGGHVA
jgi:uncharacterized protein YecE (DUF72 family)